MADRWHEYLVELIVNRSARANVEWEDLVTALEREDFVLKPTAHGFIGWHTDHPTGGTIGASQPHASGSSSSKVRRPYINRICDYLSELPGFDGVVGLGDG